ncbi:dihydrolipoamide acetyltransferase family protein [Chloroflexota bacterium]
MAVPVIFPKVDETMRTGKILRWMKKEGDWVEKGESILEIETEKVIFEIEAEESGILRKIMAKAEDEVPIGTVIAFILQPGEEAPEVPEPVIMAKGKVRVKEPERLKETEAIKASPVARKIAQEHNIDIATVKGTGPGGRIVKEDVLRAVEESKLVAAQSVREGLGRAEEQVVPLSSMRKVIARRMTASFQTVPHYWVTEEADATDLKKLLHQLLPLIEKETGVRLTYTDLLVKIIAKALKEHPEVNSSWTDEGIKILSEINIGIATDIPRGLIVPVIRNADKKSLAEIAAARADQLARGREGKSSLAEMTGGTFTLNNVGALGIKCINAIINPPESAILTVGRITDRSVVIKGEIVVRSMMDLSLGVDHRTLDGSSGGWFLQRIKELIENPVLLFF